MNMTLTRFGSGNAAGFLSTLVMPIGILILVAMMVLPLPSFLLYNQSSGFTSGVDGGYAHLSPARFLQFSDLVIDCHRSSSWPERGFNADYTW